MDQAIAELVQIGIFFSKNTDKLYAWRDLGQASKVVWLETNGFNSELITILEQQNLIESLDHDFLLQLRQLLIENTIDSILQGASSQAVHDYISQYGVSGGSQTSVQSSGPMLMNSRDHHAKFQEKELLEISRSSELLSSKYDDNTREPNSRISAIQFPKNERSIATKEINAVVTKKADSIFRVQRREFISNTRDSVRTQYIKGINDHLILNNSSATNKDISFCLPHNEATFIGTGKDHFNLYWDSIPFSGKTRNVNLELNGNKLTIVESTNYSTKTLTYSDGQGSFTLRLDRNPWLDISFNFNQKMAVNGFKRIPKVRQFNKAYLNHRDQRIDKDKKTVVNNVKNSKINSNRKHLQRDYNFIDKQFGSIATLEGIYKEGRKQLYRLSIDTKWYVSYIKQVQKTGKYQYGSITHKIKAPSMSDFIDEYKDGKERLTKLQTGFRSGLSFDLCWVNYFKNENDKNQGRNIRFAYTVNNNYYTTQKNAYVASKITYQEAIKTGDTKRQARNLATIRYFDVLAREDLRILAGDFFWSGVGPTPGDFVLPLNVERQRRAAERVIFLDRHPFAWRARLAFDIWRASMINSYLTKEDNYANKNDLGFMPWKRTKRCLNNTTSFVWHSLGHALGKAMKPATFLLNKTSSLWGGHLGTRYQHLSRSLFHITGSAAHLIGHGLLNLPNRLIKDTRILGGQVEFYLFHPLDFRAVEHGLGRDTKGIRHMAKEFAELSLYLKTEIHWIEHNPYKFFTSNNKWEHGLYHKRLHTQLKMVEFVFSVMGIMPYRRALKTAFRIDIMKRTIKKKIHKKTDLLHPNKKLSNLPIPNTLVDGINAKVSSLSNMQKVKLTLKYRNLKKSGNLTAAVSAAFGPNLATWYQNEVSTVEYKTAVWVNKNVDAKTLKTWTRNQLTKDYREASRLVHLDRYAHVNKKQSRIAERDAFFVYQYQPYSYLKEIKTYKATLSKTLEYDWKYGGGKYEFQGLKNYLLFTCLAGNKNLQNMAKKKINNNSYGYNMFTDILLAYAISHLFQGTRPLASRKALVEMVSTNGKSTKKALIDYRKYLIRTQKLKEGALASEKGALVSIRKKYRNISRLRRIGSLEIDTSSVNYLAKQWKSETLLNPIAHLYAETFSPSAKQVTAYKQWIDYNRTEGNSKKPKRGLQTAFDYASGNKKSDLYYTTTQLQVDFQNWNGEPITVGQLVKTLFSPTSSWKPVVLPNPKIHKNSSGSHSNSSSGNSTSGNSAAKVENSVQLLQYYAQLKFVKHLFSHKKDAEKGVKSLEQDSLAVSDKDKEILEDNVSSLETLSEDIEIIDKSAVNEINTLVEQEFKDIMLQGLDSIIEKAAQDVSSDLAREVSQVDDAIDVEIETDEVVADDLIEVALL
jgi:hypothetical protein